ncbi:MAG: zinc-dependent peptidase [Betaproteobacteria bacterium]|nr:MAG: zinc-dependent peptidase [Betaproteobacteria bacterium]
MLKAFRAWRHRRLLAKYSLDDGLWQRLSSRLVFVTRLSESEQARLRELCVLFLHEKQINAAGDFVLDHEMKLGIAIQACILILNLGLDSYDDWVEVIVYPDEFIPRQEYMNEHGLMQTDHHAYAGQAWLRGPVILSWSNVETAWRHDGANVVIHEFAHKLDMRNGDADGFPSLHADMNRERWTQTFTQAYEDLCWRLRRGEPSGLDDYACESPAEFFAVASEVFFECPELLVENYPEVYSQLSMFYRQDPASKELAVQWEPAQ